MPLLPWYSINNLALSIIYVNYSCHNISIFHLYDILINNSVNESVLTESLELLEKVTNHASNDMLFCFENVPQSQRIESKFCNEVWFLRLEEFSWGCLLNMINKGNTSIWISNYFTMPESWVKWEVICNNESGISFIVPKKNGIHIRSWQGFKSGHRQQVPINHLQYIIIHICCMVNTY